LDANSDGLLDVVTVSEDENSSLVQPLVSIFLKRPDGTFSASPIVSSLKYDRHDQISGNWVKRRSDDTAASLLDTSVVARRYLSLTPDTVAEVGGVDFNNDMLEDRVSWSENSVDAVLGRGSNIFDRSAIISLSYEVGDIEVTDTNCDGIQDLVVIEKIDITLLDTQVSRLSVYTGDGLGGFIETSTVYIQGGVLDTAIADFDHDGLPDIAVISPYRSDWKLYLNMGSSSGGQ
jgi:hypothetical protein